MVPPAPPIFSMITCCLSAVVIGWAIKRPTVSVGPPAVKGTTIVITLSGYFCALTGNTASIKNPAKKPKTRNTMVPPL